MMIFNTLTSILLNLSNIIYDYDFVIHNNINL